MTRSWRGRITGALLLAAAALLVLTPRALAEGADIPGEGFIIDVFPFVDTGDTTGASNASSASCGGSGADEWYRILPSADIQVRISLCNSNYDTVLYVLDTFLAEVACDDNFCGNQSELPCVTLQAGETYYVAVDGESGNEGPYEILVEFCEAPLPCGTCAPGATPEGEPVCFDEYVDLFNGGCNASLPTFSPIACGETVCGTAGVFSLGGEIWRDTDWYELVINEASHVTWEGVAEFRLMLIIYDGNSGCPANDLIWGIAEPCEPLTITANNLAPGTYYLWAGTADWGNWPCGSIYNARVTCRPVVPCEVVCGPGAILEGEPTCFDGYVDTYNGGCNSEPPVFQDIQCETVVCGTSGTFLDLPLLGRDTDWYRYVAGEEQDMTLDITCEFPFIIYLLDSGSGDCSDFVILNAVFGDPCQTVTMNETLDPGIYWIWVGPATLEGVPCGAIYEMSLAADPCNPVQCPEDVNGDLVVDVQDLLLVLAAWGTPGAGGEDINGDGVVDVQDLLLLLAAWGNCI